MLAKTYYTHGNSKRKTSGDQTLRWWPRSACLIHSLVLSPSVRARVCNVLLIHRPWKWWQDTQYVNRNVLLACMIRLHEITTFVHRGNFLMLQENNRSQMSNLTSEWIMSHKRQESCLGSLGKVSGRTQAPPYPFSLCPALWIPLKCLLHLVSYSVSRMINMVSNLILRIFKPSILFIINIFLRPLTFPPNY